MLVAAREEFARSGLHGASTEDIARAAGISQPYLFRLFGTKKELYLAIVRRCFRRTLETMQQAAEGLRGEEALDAMGRAYRQQLGTDPLMLQAQLQTYAAALDDLDVREAVRDGYGDLFIYAERVSGASGCEARAGSSRTGCCSTSSPPWASTRSPSPSRGPPVCWPAPLGGGGVVLFFFPQC